MKNERKEQTERFGRKVIKSMGKEFPEEVTLDNTAFCLLAVTETDTDFHVWAIRYDENAMDTATVEDAVDEGKGTHSVAMVSSFDRVKELAADVSEKLERTHSIARVLERLEKEYG